MRLNLSADLWSRPVDQRSRRFIWSRLVEQTLWISARGGSSEADLWSRPVDPGARRIIWSRLVEQTCGSTLCYVQSCLLVKFAWFLSFILLFCVVFVYSSLLSFQTPHALPCVCSALWIVCPSLIVCRCFKRPNDFYGGGSSEADLWIHTGGGSSEDLSLLTLLPQ